MTRSSLLIMISKWSSSELMWTGDNTWLQVFDRPVGTLTDAEVIQLFGDEAFRRRDELLALGERVAYPRTAQLIGRRIVEQLQTRGWSIDIDEGLAETGSVFQMSRGTTIASVAVPAQDRWKLSLRTTNETSEVDSVGEAEQWLLTQ